MPKAHCKCGTAIRVQRIKTQVSGTQAVDLGICPRCDRVRCRRCGHYDLTGTASRCSQCGSPIGIHV